MAPLTLALPAGSVVHTGPAGRTDCQDVECAVRRARDLVRWADLDCGDALTQHALVDALLAVEGLLDLVRDTQARR